MNIINKVKRIIFYRTSSKEIQYKEAMEIIKKHSDAILLDVRSVQEFYEGHLPGAICIPVYDLANNIAKIAKDREQIIIIYCQTGARSKKAAKILDDLCYTNVYTIKNGLNN